MNVLDRTPFAWALAHEWLGREEELVRRGGFALIAALAVEPVAAEGLGLGKRRRLYGFSAGIRRPGSLDGSGRRNRDRDGRRDVSEQYPIPRSVGTARG